ncbi:hypothetical protein CBR_g54446 [Chara braunii]|uniref:Uncharacterized protein n=1 Tax=Chara braunii TaxID=69332 RepID=A0A388MCB4_CHABU|nr:hypothetical protein CBR_g54446 [Chara braunii]|eukprot:GBG92145.1 hypothetical protein CBR_g54446 [Chara braunii]
MVGALEDKSGLVYLTRLQKTVLLWDYYAIQAKLEKFAGAGKKRKRQTGNDDEEGDKGDSTDGVDVAKKGKTEENDEEEEEEEEGEEEAEGEEKEEEEEEDDEELSKLRDVPVRFTDINDYLSVFEPLLLEECKVQILRGEQDAGKRSQNADNDCCTNSLTSFARLLRAELVQQSLSATFHI